MWDDVLSVWCLPLFGKGVWLTTTKGRFRLDPDMINFRTFLDTALSHASSKVRSGGHILVVLGDRP